MEKQYVAERLDGEQARVIMDEIGLTDDVDQDHLVAALDVIRDYGAALPAEGKPNGEPRKPEPMSAAQGTYIDKLWTERGGKPGDKPITTGLTKAGASKLIEQLTRASSTAQTLLAGRMSGGSRGAGMTADRRAVTTLPSLRDYA
jgi:hypothetical protein